MTDSSDVHARSVTLDELLSHARWVRELARALTRDPDAADELAQSAFAVALAQRTAPRSNVRAWLAAVLRNLARERGRREGSRRAVERASARTESLPGADELVARAESERRVAAAVLALAEPYRGTLLLHYYEGVSAGDIARRSGVPLATVASRLARGRAELRAQLGAAADRESGEPAGWVAAVAPLLERAPEPVPLAPVLAATSALLLLGVVVWFASTRGESSRAVADAGETARAPARGAADIPRAVDATETGPREPAAPPPERPAAGETLEPRADTAPPARETGRIHGRVVRSDGAPAVARRVRFLDATRGKDRYVVTDADGRFDERGLLAGAWNLATWADERELAALGRADENTGGFTDLAQRTIELAAGGDVEVVFGARSSEAVSVRGRVLLAGESVDAFLQWLPDGRDAMDRQKLARANAGRGYEAHLDAPGRHWVVATVTGHAVRAEFVVDVPPEREFTRDLVLPDGRLAGRVTSSGGEPVAAAQVELTPRGGVRPRHVAAIGEFGRATDADGRFAFDLVPPGQYALAVHGGKFGAGLAAAACAPLELSLAEHADLRDIAFVAQRGESVRGRVTGVLERARFARVFVFDEAGAPLNPLRGAQADDAARFELPALAAGRYTAVAACGGEWSAPLAFEVPQSGGNDAELVLALAPAARLDVAVDARAVETLDVRDEFGRAFGALFDPQAFNRTLRGEWSAAQYAFFLPAGNYTVVSRGAGWELRARATASLLGGETRALELAR